jgi:hypothetical protein
LSQPFSQCKGNKKGLLSKALFKNRIGFLNLYFFAQQEPAFTSPTLQVAVHLPFAHLSLHSCAVVQQTVLVEAIVLLQALPSHPFVSQFLQQSLSVHLFFLHISIHSLLHLSVQHFGLSSPKFLKLKLNRQTNANMIFFIL